LDQWFKTNKPFSGREKDMLQHREDLTSLTKTAKSMSDPLSKLLRNPVGNVLGTIAMVCSHPAIPVSPLAHTTKKRERDLYPASWGPINKFRDSDLERITALVAVLLSTLVIVVSIVVLYVIENGAVRVGILAVFTIIFTASVGLLTNSTRGELFAATAA
jgi:hypothetical protein